MDEFLVTIEKHKDEFLRYVHRNVWDSGVAEDVFSAAVLAAYESRHKYTPGTNFRAWMYRIITNKCYVANRETGRAFDSLDELPPSRVPATPADTYVDVLKDPDAVLEKCGDELNRGLRRLSTAQRTALLLRAVEKFSYQEIAEIMEIPVGTVMTHLSRGRRKLREELQDYAIETGIIRSKPKLQTLHHDKDDGKGSTFG